MISNRKYTDALIIDKNALLSKIKKITNICDCSNNMMVSIYLVKNKYFIYCNNAFENIIEKSCNKLLMGGWDFWFSMVDTKESLVIKKRIFSFFSTSHTQIPFVLKYHINNLYDEKIFIKHEIFLHEFEKQILAVNYFFDLTGKEKIESCFKVHYGSNFLEKSIKKISSREEDVLKLIADGFSSKQIAEALYISNHTAISHRKNLIKKFNVKNTAQLIKRASETTELW